MKRRVTAREFKHNALQTELTKRTSQKESLLVKRYALMPSLKDARTYELLLEKTVEAYSFYTSRYNMHSSRKLLKFKFYKRMRTQHEMDRVVDYVMGLSNHNPLIGLGNARNLGQSKSIGPPGPYKKLFNHAHKRLKGRGIIHNVNEYNTTKLTTCCFREHVYLKKSSSDKTIKTTILGVFHCKKCKTTLCRDGSAAENMLKIVAAKYDIRIQQEVDLVKSTFWHNFNDGRGPVNHRDTIPSPGSNK